MDIRALLLQVAATYDSNQKTSKGVPAQDLLRSVPKLRLPLPAGLTATGNGGNGGAARAPWVGIFDPDVTDNPNDGLYLAYIFATDLETVSLTLQQGVEELARKGAGFGTGEKLRTRLEENAERLRENLPKGVLSLYESGMNLKARSQDWRPRAYEAGNVATVPYVISEMPPEAELRQHLWQAAELLQHAAKVERETWYVNSPEGEEVTYAGKPEHAPQNEQGDVDAEAGLDGFRPKDSSTYVVEIHGRTQRKHRRHEKLINLFVPYARQRGFSAATEKKHPRDIVLTKGDEEWVVEAKVVVTGNPTEGVRGAVGQLFEYGHFLYLESSNKPGLLALFTEDVGVYADYLEQLGIASVWKTLDGWAGSLSAQQCGLVDSSD